MNKKIANALLVTILIRFFSFAKFSQGIQVSRITSNIFKSPATHKGRFTRNSLHLELLISSYSFPFR